MAAGSTEGLKNTAYIANLFGYSQRHIRDLVAAKIIPAEEMNPYRFDSAKAVQAYIKYLSGKAHAKKLKAESLEDLEKEKTLAEVELKQSKAKVARMQADEMEGRMHSSEDVEAMTRDQFYGEPAYLLRSKRGSNHIVGGAVHTVFAVVNALVGKQNLQKGNTPAVCGKAVADAGGGAVPHMNPVSCPLSPAGGAGYVILGRVRQNMKFFIQIHFPADIHPQPPQTASRFIRTYVLSSGYTCFVCLSSPEMKMPAVGDSYLASSMILY